MSRVLACCKGVFSPGRAFLVCALFLLIQNAGAQSTDPDIQTQPADLTVVEGAEARFTVTATGTAPLTYQWERDGFTLPIERSATLLLVAAQSRDSGAKYRCVVANPKGTLATREATLTVTPETTPPRIVARAPATSTTVRALTQIEITFSEPVSGVDAQDLLVNGVPASEVAGSAAGPYVFKFAAVPAGLASISFAAPHGITDLSDNQNPFDTAGTAWTLTVDPNLEIPKVRISEINASNETGLVDDNGEAVDWIELENFGTVSVRVAGWSLTDSRSDPAQWIFPDVTLSAGQRLVVFASGKDRRSVTGKLHTNFLLSGGGEFLGLYNASSPRELISALDPFPEQRVNYSYGLDSSGEWKYFATPTPAAANGTSAILGIMAPPHFSAERGYYSGPFQVYLSSEDSDAIIRYSTDGSNPSSGGGAPYAGPIAISKTTVLRAAVTKPNYLPSLPITHTYLYNISTDQRSLPAISVVTTQTNLTGRTGIIGIQGGNYGSDGNSTWRPNVATDFHNPSQHGLAWERPTSVEYFFPTNNDQFQIDCGIRVQGSDYMRPRYKTDSKFSYRFYFRGDYGEGKLEFPLFNGAVTSFDQLVLRAGHNDDRNPFLKDELMRRLFIDCGQVGSHGTFNTFFLNGVYKGYYNIVERIEKHFCQAWHGSSAEWDVLEQNQIPLDGDNANFQQMHSYIRNNSMALPANYLEASRRLDLTNFVDYLLVNIYGANGDWPGNNWRAARERTPQGIWRFYLWDAEFAFGTYGQAPTYNTFADQLAQNSEIPLLYKALTNSAEFRLFWADRVQKHFFNNGALTDANITRNFTTLRSQLTGLIPGFDNSILDSWIPQRRLTVTNHFRIYSLVGAVGAPSFNQFGGRVPAGFQLTMVTTATGPNVGIYYTTDGTDPRMRFSGNVAESAQSYTIPVTLNQTTLVKARMRNGSAWSALTETIFEVSEFGAPLRFTEVNYNPPGGEAFEFVELKNFSAAPVDLSGMSFDGINYRFPEKTSLPAGGIIVIASSAAPAQFAQRYPGVAVAGYFSNSSLSNSGERLLLRDKFNNIIASVDYRDDGGWPAKADGLGYSIEIAERAADPNSPVAWRESSSIHGSPGFFEEAVHASVILNEIRPASGAEPAWIEFYNSSDAAVSLSGFALGDAANLRRYIFPADAAIPAGGFFVQSGFPIGLAGGAVFLSDANMKRLDAVELGRQLPGNSVARIDGVWTLGVPSSGAANTPATLAASSNVVINEWLANAVSGGDDWLELYNSGSAPVPLQGMTLSVSNSIYRIPTLTFIPAGGHVRLFASERVGADQLAFKLPAAGATIRLYDASGLLLNTAAYSAQVEGVSEGRLPDAAVSITKFRGSASPGAPNYVVNANSSLVINEVMARNVRAVIDPMGAASDWIELYNSGAPVTLDGYSLSADQPEPGQWMFPTRTIIPTGGYLVVWFDKTHPASTMADGPLNTGNSLNADGGGVYFFNPQGQVADQIEYGVQAADWSIGRIGGLWNLTAQPTPGAANSSAAVPASNLTVRINEWSAETETAPAWLELYNPNNSPAAIGGMSLTDELNLASQKKFILPALSFLAPNGFARWISSEGNSVTPGEINFNISHWGESLRLYNATPSPADTVAFGLMPAMESLGRNPDGTGVPVNVFPTPAQANYVALPNVMFSKVAPAENKVELRNLTASDLDVGGWAFSNDPATPNKTTLAAGATIPARGFLAVTLPLAAKLDPDFGGTILLARASSGNLTGEETRLDYGPAETGGTYVPVRTSKGVQSRLLNATDTVVITEIMYHSSDDESSAEYLELYNHGNAPVSADGWRINGGVQFNFDADFSFEPGSTTLLVHFDPANAAARASFLARYHLASGAKLLGPLRGKLGNEGDEIVLERPLPATVGGYIPFVIVDRVVYSDKIPWPIAADGTGHSLQRIQAGDFGNDPLNWFAAAPKPLAFANRARSDVDADRIPDVWEIAHGLNMHDGSDALQDLDGDGVSNFAEFQIGTDPTDPDNELRSEVTWSDDGPLLEFAATAGQVYEIQFRESLTEGDWKKQSNAGPFETGRIVSIPILSAGEEQLFYRIVK